MAERARGSTTLAGSTAGRKTRRCPTVSHVRLAYQNRGPAKLSHSLREILFLRVEEIPLIKPTGCFERFPPQDKRGPLDIRHTPALLVDRIVIPDVPPEPTGKPALGTWEQLRDLMQRR